MAVETGALGDQLTALEASLGASAQMVAAFDGQLGQLQGGLLATGREVASLSAGIGGGLKRAFDGLVFGGASLSQTLQTVAKAMADSMYAVAMRPVSSALGTLLANGVQGALPFAQGAAFSQGRVVPFATGGVVSSPTTFPMKGATGLMGEAGPEAIMPLTRGPDGRLGVQMQGGGAPVSVVFNITTPDVAGFRRSQGQIAAQMGRALGQGQRNA